MQRAATTAIVYAAIGGAVAVALAYLVRERVKKTKFTSDIASGSISTCDLRSGDLLLSSKAVVKHPVRRMTVGLIKMFTGSPFHHAGVSWKNTSNGTQTVVHVMLGGMRVENVHSELLRGKRVVALRLDPPLSHDVMLRVAHSMRDIRYNTRDGFMASARYALSGIMPATPARRPNDMICSDFAIVFLQRAGVVKEILSDDISGTSPADLYMRMSSIVVLRPPYRFLPPVHVHM